MTKYHNDDENLPNFIKRKHPRKRKRNKVQRPQFRQAKEPQKRESHEGKGSKRAPKRRATWRKGNH